MASKTFSTSDVTIVGRVGRQWWCNEIVVNEGQTVLSRQAGLKACLHGMGLVLNSRIKVIRASIMHFMILQILDLKEMRRRLLMLVSDLPSLGIGITVEIFQSLWTVPFCHNLLYQPRSSRSPFSGGCAAQGR